MIFFSIKKAQKLTDMDEGFKSKVASPTGRLH